ncbi:MAG: transglycosylase SLT domain-containing protein [Pseudomonadota bacterium]
MRPAPLHAGPGLCLGFLLFPFILDCYAGDPPAAERVFVSASRAPADPSGQEEPIAGAEEITTTAPAPAPADKLVQLGPAFALPSLPLDAATMELLERRAYREAAAKVTALDPEKLGEKTRADRAFLLAWLQVRDGHAELAVPLLPEFDLPGDAPQPYVDLLAGELLLADGEPLEALPRLEAVTEDSAAIWPRARVLQAEALYKLERTADARAIYEALIARPDPAEGSSVALYTLARRAGLGSPEAYPLLRRLWRAYPGSPEEVQARTVIAQYEARGAAFKPTLADQAARGEAWMDANRYREAISLLGPVVQGLKEPSPEACQAWYTLGRSQFRSNDLTSALAVLQPAGEACPEHDTERGAKALYLAGKALERRKEWAGAAAVYARIPALYPEHSMADDGWVLAGIGWQESGQQAKAMEAWATQVEAYPDGDTAPEGFWRLAWNCWLQGDTPTAISWADRAAEVLDPATDPVLYQAALYWRWRWRVYGDREQPGVITADDAQRAMAVQGLLSLCAAHPGGYYALLAAARLQELAPDELAALPAPGWGGGAGAWQVRASFLETSAAQNAMALARVGLLAEAVFELDQLREADMIPGEIGSFTDLMVASGQWLWAHARLRAYLDDHQPETLATDRARLLTSAYPLRYEPELLKACDTYAWDRRIFHALVREESNFNQDIVSHAGARGLSQLMPATARSVGKWLGLSVSNQMMFDPATNLRIGARYLQYLMEHYRGDPFLALAGYNAGEGNVDKWLRERGNRPVDEFVEAIPLRETRRYVKRVSGTWQTYHLLYEPDAPPFPALSAFNAAAVPGRE